MQFALVGSDEGGQNITVYVPGRAPLVAASTHPNFDAIVERALAQDESVVELFDVSETAATKFERLTERVTAANGRLYLDGEEVANPLSEQVVRFLKEGVEDWKPLVNFFENIQANPNEHSRDHLYRWLEGRDFTITPEGMIVGYKGVKKEVVPVDEHTVEEQYLSIFTGKALVDGEVVNGHVPNKINSLVEMPRNEVTFDPANGCSVGLHVGTWRYASGFGRGAVLEVHVNPRDVVSVPTDSHDEKMRVCRYRVVGVKDVPYSEALADDWLDDNYYDDGPIEDDERWCDNCGEELAYLDRGNESLCESCREDEEDRWL